MTNSKVVKVIVLTSLAIVGCGQKTQPQVAEPAHIKPPTGYTPELWVIGGMGSYVKNPNDLYVARALQKKIDGAKPDVCVTSLTRESGENSIMRNLVNTPAWLDGDANQQAIWALKMFVNPKKDKGHFVRPDRTTKIRVILVAPCTQTLPPKNIPGVDLEIVVFRDPKDPIPNQELKAPRDMKYFSQFGDLKVLDTKPDLVPDLFGTLKPGGLQGHHHFSGYWHRDLPLLIQESNLWKPGGLNEDTVELLETKLNSSDVDYVLIGHSQGANIIMKMLHIGCDAEGKKNAEE